MSRRCRPVGVAGVSALTRGANEEATRPGSNVTRVDSLWRGIGQWLVGSQVLLQEGASGESPWRHGVLRVLGTVLEKALWFRRGDGGPV